MGRKVTRKRILGHTVGMVSVVEARGKEKARSRMGDSSTTQTKGGSFQSFNSACQSSLSPLKRFSVCDDIVLLFKCMPCFQVRCMVDFLGSVTAASFFQVDALFKDCFRCTVK